MSTILRETSPGLAPEDLVQAPSVPPELHEEVAGAANCTLSWHTSTPRTLPRVAPGAFDGPHRFYGDFIWHQKNKCRLSCECVN